MGDLTEFVSFVLIVAKCIVNEIAGYRTFGKRGSINSSKVYCKFFRLVNGCYYYVRINSSKVYCKWLLK